MDDPRSAFVSLIASPLIKSFIQRQRDALAPRALALSNEARAAVKSHFNKEDLDRVRVVVADPLPIPDPPFSGLVRKLGFDFPDLSFTAAITFDHVIATRQPMSDSLLFHEMVHVVQYRILGLPVFARRYVQGFLSSGSYHGIPLEKCAYELEARFTHSSSPFLVETEVRKWMERF